MLSQLDQLSVDADGRYASNEELMFLRTYLQSARLRFRLYQKLQRLEPQIVQEVLSKLKAEDPTLLQGDGQDLTAKWQRDTVRNLRYIASALLIDDTEMFKERLLLWFQTIMRSFQAQRSCNATYRVMQTVIQRHLTQEESDLVCPLLELSRSMLS